MSRFAMALGLILTVGCGPSGPTKAERLATAVTTLEAERAQLARLHDLRKDAVKAQDEAVAQARAGYERIGETMKEFGKNPHSPERLKSHLEKLATLRAEYGKDVTEWDGKIKAQAARVEAAKAARDAIEAER
jgi:outer membrane murein-binding lipoprotein Lpp